MTNRPAVELKNTDLYYQSILPPVLKLGSETYDFVVKEFDSNPDQNEIFISGPMAWFLLLIFRDPIFEITEYNRLRFPFLGRLIPRKKNTTQAAQGFFLPRKIEGYDYQKVFLSILKQFNEHLNRMHNNRDEIIFADLEHLIEGFDEIKKTRFTINKAENFLRQFELVNRASSLGEGLEAIIKVLRSFYDVDSVDPLKDELENIPAEKPELSFKGTWENPWQLKAQYQMEKKGSLFLLEKDNRSYRETWEIAVRFPKLCSSVGIYSTFVPSLYIGDADWINSNLEIARKNNVDVCQFKFIDHLPKGVVRGKFNPRASYHFSGWMAISSFAKNEVLLSGDSYLWYHDRFAHFLGYAYLGWFPEIIERFQSKCRFLLKVREMMKAEGLYIGEGKKTLIEYANEMSRLLDFASGNITAILARERIEELPRGRQTLKGFHILGGKAPFINNFSRPYRPEFLQVRDNKDFEDTKVMAKALIQDLKCQDSELSSKIEALSKRFYSEPLNVDQVFDLVISRLPSR